MLLRLIIISTAAVLSCKAVATLPVHVDGDNNTAAQTSFRGPYAKYESTRRFFPTTTTTSTGVYISGSSSSSTSSSIYKEIEDDGQTPASDYFAAEAKKRTSTTTRIFRSSSEEDTPRKTNFISKRLFGNKIEHLLTKSFVDLSPASYGEIFFANDKVVYTSNKKRRLIPCSTRLLSKNFKIKGFSKATKHQFGKRNKEMNDQWHVQPSFDFDPYNVNPFYIMKEESYVASSTSFYESKTTGAIFDSKYKVTLTSVKRYAIQFVAFCEEEEVSTVEDSVERVVMIVEETSHNPRNKSSLPLDIIQE